MTRPLGLFVLALGGCPENQIVPHTDDPDTPIDTDTGVEPDDTGDDNIPDDVLTGGVMGRICAVSDHIYMADAKVSLEHEYGVATTYTDADGFFILKDIPAGTYTIVVTKGTSFSTMFEVYIPPNEIIELAEEECLDSDLNIAVITGEYDNIGHILSQLGLTYDVYSGFTDDATDFLRDPGLMEEYDIIFMNCGLSYETGILGHMPAIGANVRDYVNGGGKVYASDWAYYITETAFPDMVDFRGSDETLLASALGVAGSVTAEVMDGSMQAALGGTSAAINFDLDVWITPVASGGGASNMVYSKYRYYSADYSTQHAGEGPLAVKLEGGEGGSVIFTAFHNEAQSTEDMEVLLREIIFAL